MAHDTERDTLPLQRLEGTPTPADHSPCAACGMAVVEVYCQSCGFEVGSEPEDESDWPQVGDVAPGRLPVNLEASLPAPTGALRFVGGDGREGRYEVLVTRHGDPQHVLRDRTRARGDLGGLALEPTWSHTTEALEYTVTRLPKVRSIADVLAAAFDHSDASSCVERAERWVVPLLRCLAGLNDAGHFLGALEPAELLVGGDGRCAFRCPPQPYSLADAPIAPGPRRVVPGFAAPEQTGGSTGRLDARTDVFLAGLVLYYLLAEAGPLEETTRTLRRLPSPLVFNWNAPAGLCAVAIRATSPVPARRYASPRQMLRALEVALDTFTRRASTGFERLSVDIGRELHIGVLKGQYTPINQDNLFAAWHPGRSVGMLLISDGVSISEHGTGDKASACVRREAADLWRRITRGEAVLEGEEPSAHEPVLPAAAAGRERLIREMLDRANARIADLVHEERPQFTLPPEGIMAATAVCAIIEGNRVTLACIGDSRIYLVRDDHIISLMVDHDLGTQLIRMGRTPTAARAAPSAAALIRCVGEFDKDGDRLVPVPLQPEFRELTLLPGDTLMLCSDGLPDYGGYDHEHAEEQMRQIIEAAPGAPWAAFELMVLANRGGGGDNISTIVARFGERSGGRA